MGQEGLKRIAITFLWVAITLGAPAAYGTEKPSAPELPELDEKSKKQITKVASAVSKSFALELEPDHHPDFAKRALERFDKDVDAALCKQEIKKLLAKAEIGNCFTRGSWAKGLLELLDEDESGKLDQCELEVAFVCLCIVHSHATGVQNTEQLAQSSKKSGETTTALETKNSVELEKGDEKQVEKSLES